MELDVFLPTHEEQEEAKLRPRERVLRKRTSAEMEGHSSELGGIDEGLAKRQATTTVPPEITTTREAAQLNKVTTERSLEEEKEFV